VANVSLDGPGGKSRQRDPQGNELQARLEMEYQGSTGKRKQTTLGGSFSKKLRLPANLLIPTRMLPKQFRWKSRRVWRWCIASTKDVYDYRENLLKIFDLREGDQKHAGVTG